MADSEEDLVQALANNASLYPNADGAASYIDAMAPVLGATSEAVARAKQLAKDAIEARKGKATAIVLLAGGAAAMFAAAQGVDTQPGHAAQQAAPAPLVKVLATPAREIDVQPTVASEPASVALPATRWSPPGPANVSPAVLAKSVSVPR